MRWLLLVVLVSVATSMATSDKDKDGGKARERAKVDDSDSLPHLDLDLDSLYYETALGPGESSSTLLASTLDGHLVALSQDSGEVLWEIIDEPVVKSPYDSSKPVLPAFLPDPKDGSIYMIGGGLKDPLKKLPFTIPELVAASPCKSSDGILYTGKKVDTWMSVDRYTGDRQGTMSFNGCVQGVNDQCPNLNPANILIGRTEYNILMHDSRGEGRRWNISFFDYSSNLAGNDVGSDYDLAHFTDSSSGFLVTLDRSTGAIQWEKQIGSPIVALYRLEDDGIISVPFTSVSKETLGNLMSQFSGDAPDTREIIGETKLYPTLYVGEHEHGLYAMPSLVDEQTLTIAPSTTGPLLLEGPQNFQMPSEINLDTISNKESANARRLFSDDPLGIPLGPEMPSGRDKSTVLLFDNQTLKYPGLKMRELGPGKMKRPVISTGKMKRALQSQKFAISSEMRNKADHSRQSSALMFGYYQVPDQSTIKLSPAVSSLQLTSAPSSHHHMTGVGGVRQHLHQVNQHPFFDGQVDERGVVSGVFPSQGKVAFHVPGGEGELNHPALRDKNGNSYSSTYYYYEVSPRDGEDVGLDGDVDDGSFGQLSYDEAVVEEGCAQVKRLNLSFILSKDFVVFTKEYFLYMKEGFLAIENKELKAIVVLLLLLVYILFKHYKKAEYDFASSRRGGLFSTGSRQSGGSYSRSASSAVDVTAQAIELDDGRVRVGSIVFSPNLILGKGCEGTFVFRGRFDNRDVAVKRVLNAEVGVADREVELLRESDEHPNVIRYFCMEQDRQFRYIALEYCQATLQDYVDGRYTNSHLDAVTILRQATQGLLHLHTLEIVHRDIKPQNVLISMPGRRGEVRAMISDFGLCKKLKLGRMSFSRRSGVAGTEGWIAPEMMDGDRSNTCAVDIFSLGCVYYFVLSRGHHPFGEAFHRQGNIQNGRYDLSRLSHDVTAKTLVERMVQKEAFERPTTQAVLKHPLFWSRERVLAFLQDVSDRVDKEDADSALVESLERGRSEVVRTNWHDWLDDSVREDLRKHRTYNGRQVRDLLRALRNKKHHYNELPENIKAMYGRIPDQFVNYWTSRFPRLVIHSWHAMHSIKSETTFQKYFDKDYDFLQTHYRPNMSLIPESMASSSLRHRSTVAPGTRQLFEPNFLNNECDHEEERFYLTAAAVENKGNEEDRTSVLSKWEDLDSGRIDRSVPAPSDAIVTDSRDCDDDEDDEAFLEMLPSRMPPGSDKSPFMVAANGKDGQLQDGQQPQPQQLPGSPRKLHKIVQLNSEAREEELADLQRRKDANKPSWSEAVRNITAEDKISHLEPTQEETEEEKGLGADAQPCNQPMSKVEESSEKLDEDNEDETEGDGNPKWVLDERVTAEAKKRNKKKKRKPSKAT